VADALAARVTERSTVVWLGAPYDPRRACEASARQTQALEILGASVDAAGVYAVGNPQGRRCGSSGPPNALSPDTHYLIDLGAEGGSVHTPCYRADGDDPSGVDSLTCPHPAPDASTHLRLVVVDETLWFNPEWDDDSHVAKLELAELDAIIDAIPADSPVPHLLVTHYPVESQGIHGLGGFRALTTYSHHPKSVQRALADGRIQGVVAGLEANLQYADDLALAVKRSSRVWLEAPIFQVVSGSAGDADVQHQGSFRTRTRWTNIALTNDRISPRAGFAQLGGDRDTFEVQLHSLHGRKWKTSASLVEATRPPHPAETPAPPLAPCRNCDPVQGATDGEKWEHRRD
jgi:hypothetical protein